MTKITALSPKLGIDEVMIRGAVRESQLEYGMQGAMDVDGSSWKRERRCGRGASLR